MDGNYQDYKTIFVNFEFTTETYDFVLYPNPNYNNRAVYLQSNYDGEINLQIFDMKGKLVYQELMGISNENIKLINNLNLSPAVYAVVISSSNQAFLRKTIKLIVQ